MSEYMNYSFSEYAAFQLAEYASQHILGPVIIEIRVETNANTGGNKFNIYLDGELIGSGYTPFQVLQNNMVSIVQKSQGVFPRKTWEKK